MGATSDILNRKDLPKNKSGGKAVNQNTCPGFGLCCGTLTELMVTKQWRPWENTTKCRGVNVEILPLHPLCGISAQGHSKHCILLKSLRAPPFYHTSSYGQVYNNSSGLITFFLWDLYWEPTLMRWVVALSLLSSSSSGDLIKSERCLTKINPVRQGVKGQLRSYTDVLTWGISEFICTQ